MKMRFQAIVLLVLFMSQKVWTCQHGDIRFLNQEDLPSRCYYSGGVEVCLHGTWRTVCYQRFIDNWNAIDAGVACTQLGHSRNGSIADYTYFHNHWLTGQSPIHLNCNGSEHRLIDCQHSSQTSTCYYHSRVAVVHCQPVVTGCPQKAEITVQSPTTLNISWLPPNTSEIYGTLRWYRVICSGSGSSHFNRTQTSSIQMVGLRPYTNYSCCISAITSEDEGTTVCNNTVTSEAAPTLAPQSVRGSSSSTSLSIYWSSPPSEYLNGQIRKYQIHVTDATTNLIISFDTTQNTSWGISSLHPHTSYRCTVAAVTVAPGPSATIIIWTKESAPTAAPQIDIEKSGAMGSTSLSLYWSPPPSHQLNGRIRYYRINVTKEATNTHTLFTAYNTQWAISNLHPYTSYLCGVAAVTVSKGPSAFITIRTNESVPTVAPTVSGMVRWNATAIIITLQPLTQRESRGAVTHYNIRYRGFEPLGMTCCGSNLTMSTTPAATYMDGLYVQLLVNQLDPQLSYCLEVAAATSVGVGPSSEPIAVGLYSNDPFQVHLSGDMHCDHWLAYRPSFKWDEISQAIAGAIQGRCYCPFTSEYIADGRLMCSGSDSVVFQGRIISTNSPPNRELLEYLQEWVRSTPTVNIEGVHLHISNCSVYLNEHELGSTEANCTEAAGQSAVRISIAITTSALVVIIVVASTIICSVYCWRKRTTTEDKRDSNLSEGDTDGIDEPKTCNEYSTQHSIRKGRKCKSAMKPEMVKLTCRKPSGAALSQDTSLPHPEIQSRLPQEDEGMPILPPRLYLEDEDFTSQLHDNTMQNTATNPQEMAVHFQVRGNVIQTHEVPSSIVNENAIYQPLLPKRIVTEESSESSVYQPLTFGGTTNHKEEKEKSMQSATRNENSTYQPLTFKSATRKRKQNGEERGQLATTKESSETNHYQPLVFPKKNKTPYYTHNDDILTSEPDSA